MLSLMMGYRTYQVPGTSMMLAAACCCTRAAVYLVRVYVSYIYFVRCRSVATFFLRSSVYSVARRLTTVYWLSISYLSWETLKVESGPIMRT